MSLLYYSVDEGKQPNNNDINVFIAICKLHINKYNKL